MGKNEGRNVKLGGKKVQQNCLYYIYIARDVFVEVEIA